MVTIGTSGAEPAISTATVAPAGTTVIRNAKQPTLTADLTAETLSGNWGSDTVLWIDDAKLIVDGNELLRPSSEGEGWDAGAVSSRTFTGDGYMETISQGTGMQSMVGFSSADNGQHFIDLDFGFFLHRSGQLEAYESGIQRGTLTTHKAGDVLRLERSGTDLIYSVNGLVRRTTTVDAATPFKVDCSLHDRNTVVNNTTLVLPTGGARATSTEAIRDAVTIHLDSGWSLIGIPLELDNTDASVLGDFVNDDSGVISSLEAGKGYWVFNADAARSVVLTGVRPAQPAPAAGWSLYAPVANSAAPTGAIVWAYADGAWRLVEANESLTAGVGYRVYSE